MLKHTLSILALLLMPLFSLSAQDITFEQVMEKCRENIQSVEFDILVKRNNFIKNMGNIQAVRSAEAQLGFTGRFSSPFHIFDRYFLKDYEVFYILKEKRCVFNNPIIDYSTSYVSSDRVPVFMLKAIFGKLELKELEIGETVDYDFNYSYEFINTSNEIIFEYEKILKINPNSIEKTIWVFDADSYLIKTITTTNTIDYDVIEYSISNTQINTIKVADIKLEIPLDSQIEFNDRSWFVSEDGQYKD